MSDNDLAPIEYEHAEPQRSGSSSSSTSYVKYGIAAMVVLALFGLGVIYHKGRQSTSSVLSANSTGQFPYN